MNKHVFTLFTILTVSLMAFTHNAGEHPSQIIASFGYTDKGDSVEFVFGQQKTIKIGTLEFVLDKRRGDIKQVSVAGEFNHWNPNSASFIMKKTDAQLFKLVISKDAIGKKGATMQFKFVLNGKYWLEPPVEAANKITGKDGNTNLTLKL